MGPIRPVATPWPTSPPRCGFSRQTGTSTWISRPPMRQRIEAIISSMTREERGEPSLINGSRRKRIAAGSGTKVSDVNQLLKQFAEMQKMMKQMGALAKGGRLPKIPGL